MTEGAHRLVAAILLSLVFLSCGEALAQTAAAAVVDPGLWDRTMAWIFAEQRAWHHDLVAQMRGLGDGGQATAQTIVPWALILASFLYGLFHAAGPGHGKVVLASYLLSHRQRVGRGVEGFVELGGREGLLNHDFWVAVDVSTRARCACAVRSRCERCPGHQLLDIRFSQGSA